MFELQVTLNELKGLPRLFDNFTRQLALKADEEYFPNIRQLIVEIDSRSPEIVAPKSPRPEYRLQWDSYRQGKRAGIYRETLKNEHHALEMTCEYMMLREQNADVPDPAKFVTLSWFEVSYE